MSCNYCNAQIYIKVRRYLAPVLAPLTRAEELKQELMNITGEDYVLIDNGYCPMCGERREENAVD